MVNRLVCELPRMVPCFPHTRGDSPSKIVIVDFSSLIVAVFERIAVEYTYRISSLFATQLTVEKFNSVD